MFSKLLKAVFCMAFVFVAMLLTVALYAQTGLGGELITTNQGLLKSASEMLIGAKSGHWTTAGGAASLLLWSILKSGDKIPFLNMLGVPVLVSKIPKAYFAVIVVAVAMAVSMTAALVQGADLQVALNAGFDMGLIQIGLHEIFKRSYRGVTGKDPFTQVEALKKKRNKK